MGAGAGAAMPPRRPETTGPMMGAMRPPRSPAIVIGLGLFWM